MNPVNQHQPVPLILTGPKCSEPYFRSLDEFIRATLGDAATRHYEIIIGDAEAVGQSMKTAMAHVHDFRKAIGDAYSFNWALHIESDFQLPFEPTHENMAKLDLHLDQPAEKLACNLRKAFSGIVAGNVKDKGIKAIEQNGPFKLTGDKELMLLIDKLLQDFISQHRMKLPGSTYIPCYEIQL